MLNGASLKSSLQRELQTHVTRQEKRMVGGFGRFLYLRQVLSVA
jgi:hypothetical protein